jgi:CelD/BcsL family acetyltransferase involved in cellulose biosynthesis
VDTAFYVPLPKTWDEYLYRLGKKRYYVKRALRDFETGCDARLHEATTAEELREGMRILHTLHAERWHGGLFRFPRFASFHDAVMPGLLEEGRLQLLWLTVGGQPVAALYNIVANNKVYFYQSGRSMAVSAKQRPGIVLLAYAIQKAIAAGRREFDFLGGVMQYKSQLALATRPLMQLRAAPPSFRERARQLAERAYSWARRVRNRLWRQP